MKIRIRIGRIDIKFDGKKQDEEEGCVKEKSEFFWL